MAAYEAEEHEQRLASSRVESVLFEQAALMQEAQVLAGIGSWYWDPSAEMIFWSPNMPPMHGVDSEHVPRTLDDYLQLVHPEDRSIVQDQIRLARRSKQTVRAAYRIVKPDGALRYLSMTAAAKPQAPGKEILFGTVQDVTDLIERERSLDETRTELQSSLSILGSLLESSVEGIMLVSHDGYVTTCNYRMMEMWGLSGNRLKGRRIQDVHRLFLSKVLRPTETMEATEAALVDPNMFVQDTMELTDGRVFERSSHPHMIDGVPAGRVWKFCDITERYEAETRIRQAQKMEAVGRLASGIAHDFNNLLAAISNLARFIGDEAVGDEVIMRDVGRIIAACRQGESLTRGLLAYAKREPVDPRPISIRKSVDDLSDWLRRALPDNVALVVEHRGAPRAVFIDPFRLSQVIMNLAINGADAMPDGGTLKIETVGSDEEVSIACVDEGTGLDPSIRHRIFDPFFSTKERSSGTGLGLSIVQGVVEQAGGRIEVRSGDRGGTIFELRFPACDEPIVEADRGPVGTLLHGPQPRRVLLVEDDPRLRQVTERILWSAGYEVFSFPDPLGAIEAAPAADMLVTDVLMPGMSGIELARRLALPCLLVSGYASEDMDHHDRPADLPLLDKPFTRNELLVAVGAAWTLHNRGKEVVVQADLQGLGRTRAERIPDDVRGDERPI